jgi:diacylglycerol kinase (ATP)
VRPEEPSAAEGAGRIRSRHLLDSSRYAVEGLVHVLHRDWHMRVLLLIGALLLLASAVVRVTKVDLLLICLAIALVVMAEVMNSAIETVVDLVSPEYHPLAKVAKDVGGAGVLVAIVMGVLIVIGVLVNAETLEALRGVGGRPLPHPLHVLLVGVVTVVAAVITGKLWGGRGTLTRGGVISAHSAVAFFCFVSIWFLTPGVIERLLAFLLAVLVAQSRVDAGIHTVREVLIGAVVALVVGFALYGALAMRAGG